MGQAGVVDAVPQRLEDGKWRRAPNARAATRWRARCYYRGQDGIRREVTRFAATKREAERQLDAALEYLTRAGDGTMVQSMPLITAGELWFSHISRPGGMAAKTLVDYTYVWRRYVDAQGSSIRGLTLAQANDPQRLRGFLQRLADTYGAAEAKKTRSVLNGTLSLAVGNGVLPSNAMLQVGSIGSTRQAWAVRDHRRAFTAEQRDTILEYAYAQAEKIDTVRTQRKARAVADLAALMAGTGVRIEEARSMLWSDIDLDTGAIVVQGTKTEGSLRRVDAPGWLLGRLQARAALTGTAGLVVPTPGLVGRPDAPWEQSNSSSALRKLFDDCGHPWAVPHTFRRTVASLLHQAGVPVARIADWLGHENTGTTVQHYLGRDLSGSKRDLADLL